MNIKFTYGNVSKMPTCKYGRVQGFCQCWEENSAVASQVPQSPVSGGSAMTAGQIREGEFLAHWRGFSKYRVGINVYAVTSEGIILGPVAMGREADELIIGFYGERNKH